MDQSLEEGKEDRKDTAAISKRMVRNHGEQRCKQKLDTALKLEMYRGCQKGVCRVNKVKILF